MTNEILPFRALHYNTDSVDRIADCLSQPYDVISPELQEEYYARSELNVVRLILNKEREDDTKQENRYTRARKHLRRWRERGVLVPSEREAFWIYEQEYSAPDESRARIRGFIGAVRLQELDSGSVVPHEKIMKGPLEDRLRLTRETWTQLESIWGFYREESGAVEQVMQEVCADPPLFDTFESVQLRHGEEVVHRLWRCDKPEHCDAVRHTVGRCPIYIADGHHRYHTMLAFRDEARRHRGGADGPWEYISMWLVNASAQTMTVLPYHRLFGGKDGRAPAALLDGLSSRFDVRPFGGAEKDDGGAGLSRRQRLTGWIHTVRRMGEGSPSFGLALRAGTAGAGQAGAGVALYTVTLRQPDEYAQESNKHGHSRRWRMLDVNILNGLVFERILGLDEAALSASRELEYTHSVEEAVTAVESGTSQAAFVMNPTRISDVIALSDQGEVLPRKSTFFYPKPVSGLVMYPMAETESV